MRGAEVRFKECRQLTKKKDRPKKKTKKNKTKQNKTNRKYLSFKKPMNYDRFERLYVKRSMLKMYDGYWHYNLWLAFDLGSVKLPPLALEYLK